MSATAEVHAHDDHHAADDGHGHDEHHGPTDKQFVGVAIFLAGLTAIEVLISYIDIGPVFLPLLLGLMALKFVVVVLYFMHLKFDSKWFNMAFWSGLGLAVLVYVAAITTFKFWSK